MAITVVDRVADHPGRIKLTPVAGQQNIYDMARADEPTVTGTPINASLLNGIQADIVSAKSLIVTLTMDGSYEVAEATSTLAEIQAAIQNGQMVYVVAERKNQSAYTDYYALHRINSNYAIIQFENDRDGVRASFEVQSIGGVDRWTYYEASDAPLKITVDRSGETVTPTSGTTYAQVKAQWDNNGQIVFEDHVVSGVNNNTYKRTSQVEWYKDGSFGTNQFTFYVYGGRYFLDSNNTWSYMSS